jgi:hypothetical protein
VEPETNERPQITITLPIEDLEDVRGQLGPAGADFLVASSEGFDGSHTVDILLSLTPSIAAFVAGLYATRVRANRFISLKRKGLEVKGVSEATLLKIIEKSSRTGETK